MSIEGWDIGLLGEVCSITIGGTPSRANPAYWDIDKSTENLWVSIRDLNQRIITDTAEYLTKEGVKNSNVKKLLEGTVLLSFKLTIGRVAIAGKDLYTNEAIAGLCNSNIFPNFLYYGLQQWDLLQGVDQAIKGATLNKQKLNKIQFNYPKSIKEQEKIAEVLSAIDRAIAQTEAIIAKQQRIKTGLMQDLLTKGIDENGNIRSETTYEFKDSEIGRIPVEWDVLTLDKVADILDPNPSHRNPIYIEYGYPFISTVELIAPDKIEINTPRRVSESTVLEQEKRCFFSPNSIAFSRKGTIGKTRILPSGIRFALLDSLCVINAKKGTNSHFIYQMLRSHPLKQQIDSATMGVALPQMSIGRVRTLLIPVPNNEQEQSTIVNQISLISMREIQLWNELTKINLVKTGLMQDLLTGKVRVTNLLNQKAAVN
jgi:type I restriction enzyme S subunit